MTMLPLNQLEDPHLAFALMIHHIDAVDLERELCLWTTSGMTRGARRWFVHRYDTEKRSWISGERVSFRAWNLDEALQRLTEPRLAKRIGKLVIVTEGGAR